MTSEPLTDCFERTVRGKARQARQVTASTEVMIRTQSQALLGRLYSFHTRNTICNEHTTKTISAQYICYLPPLFRLVKYFFCNSIIFIVLLKGRFSTEATIFCKPA